jgi:hypothetical protein
MIRIFNDAEFREAYGEFFKASPGLDFDVSDVPEAVAGLIPYARFWGITDDYEREDLVEQAPLPLRKDLRTAVFSHEDALDDWLAGSEASAETFSDAYVAFTAMRMAADSAELDE